MIVVIPAYTQKPLLAVSDSNTAQTAYESKTISNKTAWSKTFSLEKPFNISLGRLQGCRVEYSLEFFVDAKSDTWRNTTITYAFLCNGKEVRTMVEHVDGIYLRFGGSYPEESIDSGILKFGRNTLVVNAAITSESTVAGESSFLLRIDQISVSGVNLDLDGDGILDTTDPLIAVNNYHVIPIAAMLSFPAFAVIERCFKSARR
jgi:hypothetical protein